VGKINTSRMKRNQELTIVTQTKLDPSDLFENPHFICGECLASGEIHIINKDGERYATLNAESCSDRMCPVYGTIYLAYDNNEITISSTTAYTRLTGFAGNGGIEYNLSADYTNSRIIVNYPGIYSCSYSLSYAIDTDEIVVDGGIFCNDEIIPQIHSTALHSKKDTVRSSSCKGILNITNVPAEITLKCRHTHVDSVNFNIEYMNITLYRIK
jgi:hypothetical protein